MTYLVAKFVLNFAVYCGKKKAPSTIRPFARMRLKLAYKVVMELSKAGLCLEEIKHLKQTRWMDGHVQLFLKRRTY
jgi:hypothetical protein